VFSNTYYFPSMTVLMWHFHHYGIRCAHSYNRTVESIYITSDLKFIPTWWSGER